MVVVWEKTCEFVTLDAFPHCCEASMISEFIFLLFLLLFFNHWKFWVVQCNNFCYFSHFCAGNFFITKHGMFNFHLSFWSKLLFIHFWDLINAKWESATTSKKNQKHLFSLIWFYCWCMLTRFKLHASTFFYTSWSC